MRRQMKLICKLLAYAESNPGEAAQAVPEIPGYSEAEVHDHVALCNEAGYLEVGRPGIYPQGRRFSSIIRLTWRGHDALQELKSNGSNT